MLLQADTNCKFHKDALLEIHKLSKGIVKTRILKAKKAFASVAMVWAFRSTTERIDLATAA